MAVTTAKGALAAFNAACTVAVGSGQPSAQILTEVGAALAVVLPGDGVAVTVMTSDAARETVYASDAVIGAFDQAQYTLGDGPILVAFRTRRPVLRPDMSPVQITAQWPGLAGHAATAALGSVFCFPLGLGAVIVGVASLYRRTPARLTSRELTLVLTVMDVLSLVLLELHEASVGGAADAEGPGLVGISMPVIHQATGMLIVALGISAANAFARLRAYAFSHDLDLELVAAAIVDRRLRLYPDRPAPGP